MVMLIKRRAALALAVNILITVSTIGIVISYFCGNDGEYHIPPYFRFYLFTTDSNILCMLTSVIIGWFEIRYLRTGKPIPKAAVILKLVGTTAVALTFTVVVFFLGPTMGFVTMVFGGTSLYMHFLGPLIAFLSFCFLENVHRIEKKYLIPAALPTVIYGIVYVTMVIIIGEENGGWIDFYGFNTGGFWYISCIVIILATLGLAAVLRLVHNRLSAPRRLSAPTENQ